MAARTAPLALPDELHQHICALTDDAERRVSAKDFAGALALYAAALRLVPQPQEEWEATTWIAAAMGDAQFFLGDCVAAMRCFELAARSPGGVGVARTS